jgi:hypothetical protein
MVMKYVISANKTNLQIFFCSFLQERIGFAELKVRAAAWGV